MDIERLKILAGLENSKQIGQPYHGISSYTPPVIRQFNVNNTADNPMMSETSESDIKKLFKKFYRNGTDKLEAITHVANAVGVKPTDLIGMFDETREPKTLREYVEQVKASKEV
ncbi:hypothetical protein FDI40_gp111 [Agrobacterium phage Atu_ph07]|uniref:Uncharacterized protein n=1 Tax=Agrobacterium phage Atu_ph07 TaxID=2024264 RepID=A0A2L0UZF2_9CAUD|nr:hypothetical protein FDI40_gp111 [Agrobacterium phage Atu_ph07]AUZ94908.1 hypothetical protein [Agrobacterium phage Atu_ph07]